MSWISNWLILPILGALVSKIAFFPLSVIIVEIPGKVLYSNPGVSILIWAIGPSTFLEFVRYLNCPSAETYSNFWGIRGEMKENVVDPTPTNVWFPDNGLDLKLAELEFLILEVSLIISNLTFELESSFIGDKL